MEIEGCDKRRKGAARAWMCRQWQKEYISMYNMEEMKSTARPERRQGDSEKQTPEYITIWGFLVRGQAAQHMLCG